MYTYIFGVWQWMQSVPNNRRSFDGGGGGVFFEIASICFRYNWHWVLFNLVQWNIVRCFTVSRVWASVWACMHFLLELLTEFQTAIVYGFKSKSMSLNGGCCIFCSTNTSFFVKPNTSKWYEVYTFFVYFVSEIELSLVYFNQQQLSVSDCDIYVSLSLFRNSSTNVKITTS